jgi:hypothetical protein
MAFYTYLYASIQKRFADKNSPLGGGPLSPADLVAWRWQLGSQNGQYQISDSEPNPDTYIISKFNTWDVIAKYVYHTMHLYAPEKPDIMAIKKYGGWKMQPGNVMRTDGEMGSLEDFGGTF